MKTYPIGKIAFLLSLHFLFVIGCATRSAPESEFRHYQGEQKDWPTDTKAVPVIVDGIPVYRSMPERSYEIVGWASLPSERMEVWDVEAVRLAKNHGEAVFITDILGTFAKTSRKGKTALSSERVTKATVIRWK